jgi:putative queuosine salvage protein
MDVPLTALDALLTPPEPDRLGVLTATARVLREAREVRISVAVVDHLAARWAGEPWDALPPFEGMHATGDPEHTPNWVLLLDALNFCFWGEPGMPRWQVSWRGTTVDGYAALAAALSRAAEEGLPLTDAHWLAAITEDQMAHILRPAPGTPEIPLFAARVANAREVGAVLMSTYAGQFAQAVAAAGNDAVALALLLARDFPSFADIPLWDGTPAPLLKRAQICVADLHAACHGQGPGALRHLDELTAFADYKLPQLLRYEGALHYAPSLAGRVDAQIELAAGSPAEVEIRAATVWAVELLRRALARRGIERLASEIDYRLWLDSQQVRPGIQPYHRTRTIFY